MKTSRFYSLLPICALLAAGMLLAACGDPYAPFAAAPDNNGSDMISCLRVPQDYKSLGAALSVVAPSAQGGTICLSGGNFVENVVVPYLESTVRIVSRGPSRPVIIGSVSVRNGGDFSSLEIDGVTITDTLWIDGNIKAQVTNAKAGMLVSSMRDGYHPDLLVDRCDLGTIVLSSKPTNPGANPARKVVVSNSYIHGQGGIYVTGHDGIWNEGNFSAQLINNTLVGGYFGIRLEAIRGQVEIFNNLVYGTGIGMQGQYPYNPTRGGVGLSLREGSNAFFANTTNFSAIIPNGSDIVDDPLLDMTTTPPTPKAGSPLLGAGDPAYASDHDFTGAGRVGPITIGAIQAPSVPTTN